jgi:hypothetical protein
MTVESTSGDAAAASSLRDDVDELLDTVGRGDTVLFNDRVQPLTVERTVSRREAPRNVRRAVLSGPRGGEYKLSLWDSTHREASVSLTRKTGTTDKGHPATERLSLESVEVVDSHEFTVGQIIEVTDPIPDQSFHIVKGVPDAHGYDIKTIGVTVRDGEVADTRDSGLFRMRAKERLFEGALSVVNTYTVDYGPGTDHYYDSDRGEEVYLSSPHDRGVDLRPRHGNGLEVLDWGTVLFEFEDRFTPVSELED